MNELLASRLRSLTPSSTGAATERVRALREEGHDIIALAEGEPDFDTPDNIKAAAERAIARGETKYTAVDGTPELKDAIREKLRAENGLVYGAGEVIASVGAKHVIFNAMLASIDAGDEVVIPAPYWVSYPEIVALCGGIPVVVECPEERGFKLDAEALARVLTPRTKWVILNSPGNPSGAALSEDELRELATVLVEHPGVHVLVDDIYEHLVYDGFRFRTLAQVEPELKQRTLTVNGVSKTYCMTGWRIGYAGGPRELIAAMSAVQSHSTSNPCSVSQAAAVEALVGPQDAVARHAEAFGRRRDLVVGALNAIPGLRCPRPDGAFYVYPSCAGLLGKTTPGGRRLDTDEDFADFLLERAHVAVIPGGAFGHSPYFRISYATGEAELATACERIADACEQLR